MVDQKFGDFTGTVQEIDSSTGEVVQTEVFKEGVKVRTFRGGGGGGVTPVRTPAEAAEIVAETPEEEPEPTRDGRIEGLSIEERTALIRREEVRREALERGRGFSRLEVERRLGGGRGVRALRSARRKGFTVVVSTTPEPTPTEIVRRQALPRGIRELPPEEVEARQTLFGGETLAPPRETGTIFLKPDEASALRGETQEREFTQAEREVEVTKIVVPEREEAFFITGAPEARLGLFRELDPLVRFRERVERIPKIGRLVGAFVPTKPIEVAIDVALIGVGKAIALLRVARRARKLQKISFIGLEQAIGRGRVITRAAFEVGGRRTRAGGIVAVTERIAIVRGTQLVRTATIGAVGRRITFPLGRQILIGTRPFIARQISAIREGTLIAKVSIKGLDITVPLARAFKQVGLGVVRTTRGIFRRRIVTEPFFGIGAGVLLGKRITLAVARGRGTLGEFVSGGLIFRRKVTERIIKIGAREIPVGVKAAPLVRVLSQQALIDVQQATAIGARQVPITIRPIAVFPRVKAVTITETIRQITIQAQAPVVAPRIIARERLVTAQAITSRQAQRQSLRSIAALTQSIAQAEKQAVGLRLKLVSPLAEKQLLKQVQFLKIPVAPLGRPRGIIPIIPPTPFVPPLFKFPLPRGKPIVVPRRRRRREEELIFVPSFTAAELGITAVLSEKQLKRIARFPGVGIRPIPIK